MSTESAVGNVNDPVTENNIDAELTYEYVPGQWCLVGNVIPEQRYDEEQKKILSGTKHFSAGTKLYCLPPQWGDGYERAVVIGRQRGSKQFITTIIRTQMISDWRAKVVYHPEVLRRLKAVGQEPGRRMWNSEEEVRQLLKSITSHNELEKA